MKKLAFWLFGFSILIFSISLVSFLFFHRVIQTEVIFTSANITQNVAGIDLNTSSLSFGKVHRGGSLMRSINFTNDYSFPIVVFIDVKGDISPYLNFEHEIYFLTNETKKLSFSVAPNETAPLGVRTGNITFKIKRA